MVNGSSYYRALESVSIASALSSALMAVLYSNFLQLGRSGGRPQRTVYPRRLLVNTQHCDTHTT